MTTSTNTFKATFGAGDGTGKICYMSFVSAPEVLTFHPPTSASSLEDATTSLFAQIKAAQDARPSQVSLAVPPRLIFSRNFGLTVSFGIDDYSEFIEEYAEDCVHQFTLAEEGTYLTIVRKSIARQLLAHARHIWAAHHAPEGGDEGAPPTRVMLRCDSSPGEKATISDAVLDADLPRYFDITDVGAVAVASPQFTLQTKLSVPEGVSAEDVQRTMEDEITTANLRLAVEVTSSSSSSASSPT